MLPEMTSKLVRALADWIDAQNAPDADWDVIVRAALAEVEARRESEEAAFEDPAEGFRRGWRDVMSGNTIPASELDLI